MTYPEDTDGVERAVRGTIGLDHAEHAVELPVDEEDDEKVVGVPELLKVGTAALLHGVPDHDTECGSHDPTSDTRAGRKVGLEERDEALAGRVGVRVGKGELGEVDHVRSDVHKRAGDDRPCGGLVECDVLVEGNEVVERCAADEGDEVAADGEQDEDDIDVKHKRRRTSDGCQDIIRNRSQDMNLLYTPNVRPKVLLAPTRLSLRV